MNTSDNQSQPNDSGHARMRPRARLISLLGSELISDEAVAIVELVKNAYDADANNVSIRFEGMESGSPDSLVITDDGNGMSLATVLSAWFEPGTIAKKRGERSPGGRLYQGAKGVGRFAAARLAESLYMETKAVGESRGVSVLLEWGRFDDDSYLDEITIDYQVDDLPALRKGTTLTLINLRKLKNWGEEDFAVLHNRLSRLISPFESGEGKSEVADFEIELDVEGYPSFTGKIKPHELTSKPKYRLMGKLNSSGQFSGSIDVDGARCQTIKDKMLGDKGEKVKCGDFEIEIRAWDRDRDGLAPFMLNYNQSLTGIRQILDEYCGVSIYRDGFRVYPYGEKGNDWLSLDTRSRQTPTLRLANNQIIAAIRISREGNAELTDRTTREGLVHNEAYSSLCEWFVRVLAILESERYGHRPREKSKPDSVSTLFEPFDMSDIVSEADSQLGKRHPVTKLVKKKDSEIQDGVKRLQDHYSRLLMAAGLGQLVDVVVHEIGAPIGRLSREIDFIERLLLRKIGERAFDKLVGEGSHAKITEKFEAVHAWIEQIIAFRERLIPKSAGRRGKATSFCVQDEINDSLALYQSILSKQKITVSLNSPGNPVIVHMSRSNLGQIIANLLDNSVYWLTRHHGTGKGGKIDIQLTRLKSGFRIRISDDGPGVPEEDVDRIFDKEFSRKPNGMGLGLFICREVIEPYGKLVYSDSGKLAGACFEASFEQRVGL